MPNGYNAIIIGGGVNGLTTAAYLAKQGLRTVVLERCPELGGAAVTEEIAPGFRCDTCLHDPGWVSPTIVAELELARHGLDLLRPEAAVFSPSLDRTPLMLWRDPDRTVASIRRHSPADAERWAAFSNRVARFTQFLERLYTAPPPRPLGSDLANFATLARAGGRLRALGTEEMIELLRVLPMSAADLLDEWFASDLLKGTLGAGGVTGVLHGPRSGGTAFVLLHHHVGSETGVFRARPRPNGGVGRLAAALAAAAIEQGAEIRCGAEVHRVLVRDGSAEGVALTSGEEIRGRTIASSTDPRRTFLDLVGPDELEPEFVREVRNVRFRGPWAKVNLALGELPRFAGLNGTAAIRAEEALSGTISISPSLDYLEHAYDDAKYGRISREPYLDAVIPSLADPTLCPAGQHVMSIRVQYAPYRVADGEWNGTRRDELGDRVVETLSRYAPNLPDAILHRQVLTPRDLEDRFALTEGSDTHGELALDQILFMRPIGGWSSYRTPIRDLYLCGSGAHPGGGIAGGAGRIAAREILKHGSVRKPSRKMGSP